MQIETAIQQYLIRLKVQAPRDRVEFDLVVLARLQEYLEGDAGIDRLEAVREQHLRAFIADWYRSGEDVNPDVAEGLVKAVVGWSQWLDETVLRTGERQLTTPWLESLQEELPRTCQAALLLDHHLHRDDLTEPVSLEEEESVVSFASITAGATHVVRLEQFDVGRAEEDTFEVQEVGERSVSLHSKARDELGEGPAEPVALPPEVARLLRDGDILHGEIAPTAEGWEILTLRNIYPGGMDDRP